MNVLSVSYTLAPVSLDAAGGAEVVLAQLDAALVARGHRSIVVAPASSRVAGTLLGTAPRSGTIDALARSRACADARRAIADALARWPIDVVHFHGLDFPALRTAVPGAALATLHLPIELYPPAALEDPDLELACVSASQASALGPAARARAHVVENGVDLARFRPRGGDKGEYALALGRVCPEKNFGAAIDAARSAGVPLLIAGHVHAYPEHQAYFRDVIAPATGRGVIFVGPVAGACKARLLAGARCVLVPSTVRETSSLVAMEALASGTPVVAYPSGALADLVDDGRTGFLVSDPASMARAITRCTSIDPAACRAVAEQRFDLAGSTARWVALLEAIVLRRRESTHAA